MNPRLPKNIALLPALDLNRDQLNLVENALKGAHSTMEEALLAFSKYWKLKVTFTEPVEVVGRCFYTLQPFSAVRSRKGINRKKTHVFNSISHSKAGDTIYCTTRRGRWGYPFPNLSKVEEFEIYRKKPPRFRTYEQFKARFDLRFITEDFIKELWNGTSAQHGGKYVPSDFKRLGPTGSRVMRDFLARGFEKVTYDSNLLSNSKTRNALHAQHKTYGNGGRDISISYSEGFNRVHYASEFPGCGNGMYGLIANERYFLWLEND